MIDKNAPALAGRAYADLLNVDAALVLFLIAGDDTAPAATTAFTAARLGAAFCAATGAGRAANCACKADSLVTTAVYAFEGDDQADFEILTVHRSLGALAKQTIEDSAAAYAKEKGITPRDC